MLIHRALRLVNCSVFQPEEFNMTMSAFPAARVALTFSGLVLLASSAAAQDFYVSGGLGLNFQDDTSNRGALVRPFTTGQVTGVTPPLTLPVGAPVSWSTQYDDGGFYSLAFGRKFESFRLEAEYSWTQADIDGHRGVNAGGIDLSAVDAGVLITGNVGNLGVSTAALVADGRGDIDTDTWMLNAYYDFDLGSRLTPYVGVGLGLSESELVFNPSGVAVLSDEDRVFAWQLMGGVSYAFSDTLSLYGNYRYRTADDMEFSASLLPARFNIDVESQSLDIGIRYGF
jgi:opacity protein-like surface antigen